MDELSEDDKVTVARARKIQRFLSQPFQVAEVFTGMQGKLVPLADTIKVSPTIFSVKTPPFLTAAFFLLFLSLCTTCAVTRKIQSPSMKYVPSFRSSLTSGYLVDHGGVPINPPPATRALLRS